MEAGLATPAVNLKKVSWFNGCMNQLHVKLIALWVISGYWLLDL